MDGFWDIGKWVLIVFVTGVIAGFGKLLASWVVNRRRRRTRAAAAPGVLPSSPPAAKDPSKQQAKIEKKLAKADVKQRKKNLRN